MSGAGPTGSGSAASKSVKGRTELGSEERTARPSFDGSVGPEENAHGTIIPEPIPDRENASGNLGGEAVKRSLVIGLCRFAGCRWPTVSADDRGTPGGG